jgi:xylulokinase
VDALLGIDIGTTNIKVNAYSLQGAPLAQASQPTPTQYEGPRYATNHPGTLWLETAAAIRAVTAQLGETRVCGLAIASVGEAGVPLDARGQPLYPIVAWFDERTVPQSEWWATHVGAEACYRITGLPIGHIYSLLKMIWLREHEPQAYAQMSRWLCVSDYAAYRLTGELCMGLSLASRTLAYDLRRGAWSPEMLEAAGVAPSLMPEIRPEASLVGWVTAAAAEETGLAQGTPVYVGGHDHIVGALGVGAYVAGTVMDSVGTTETVLFTLEHAGGLLDAADQAFCLGAHVVRGRYYLIGGILSAGSTLGWLADLLWSSDQQADRAQALAQLTQAAADSPIGARGLYLLPHLTGAGAPDRDTLARGVLMGMGLDHTRADYARAALEGLAFEVRLLLDRLEALTGQQIERVISVGGGARNTLWNQIKADASGRRWAVPEHTEGVTLGAAVLAGIGAGVYADAEDAMRQLARPLQAVDPQPEAVAAYNKVYAGIAEQLRPLAAELGRKSGRLAVG